MKKAVVLLMFVMVFAFSLNFVLAQTCNLNAVLVNQDPYPAAPGDYVKLVFQLNGITNKDCGEITFEIVQDFPFSLDPGVNPIKTVQGGVYETDYKNYLLASYKVRVDKQALDEESPVKVRYSFLSGANNSYQTSTFNVSVLDLHTDFEIAVKDYTAATNNLVFEILNTGKHDVEALTVEIPKQENIAVKGSNRNIIGSLDSNEDTTFSFEAVPKKGGIKLNIFYTDEINVRRSIEKKINFDPDYFSGRNRDKTNRSPWTYVVIAIVIIGAVWWWRRKKKEKEKRHHHHNY